MAAWRAPAKDAASDELQVPSDKQEESPRDKKSVGVGGLLEVEKASKKRL